MLREFVERKVEGVEDGTERCFDGDGEEYRESSRVGCMSPLAL